MHTRRLKTIRISISATCLMGLTTLATTPVLEFGGDASYVDLGTPAALQIANNAPFTVEGWMYLKSFSIRDMLFSKSATRPTAGPYTYMFGFRDGWLAAYDGGNWWGDFDVSHETDRWYHLAFSFDGSDLRYYLDGSLVGQTAFSFGNTESDQITIGGYHNSSDIDGHKSDVRLWDHARSAGEIDSYRTVRLTGAESGLIGYWPMNEGEGGLVFDLTPNASTGTVVNASWTTVDDLSLVDSLPPGVWPAPAFNLADLETGSTRFTNSNEVEIVGLSVPEGYTHFQFTEDGDPAALGAWTLTNAIPFSESFAQPTSDTDITLYAWFTNTADSVTLRRSQGSIVYTEALPDVAPLGELTLETSGFSVRVSGSDILGGTTGGTAAGEPMAIHAMEALWDSGPYPDLTPDDPFVTLTNAGVYTVKLWVVNEAGNAALSASACTVTLQSLVDPPEGDRYVVAHNLNAAAPYDTWTTAAASIQTAVNAADAGETLLMWPGRYTLPTNAVNHWGADNVVLLDKPLTIRGVGGREDTIIDGEGLNRGIAVDYAGLTEHPLRFEGLSISSGYAPAIGGGGIRLGHAEGVDALLNDCIVVHNATPVSGGGIQLVGNRSLILSNSLVHGNTAGAGGGGIHASGSGSTLDVQGTTLSANEAGTDGGGIFSAGTATIADSLLEGNAADNNGGGVHRNALEVTRSTFRENSAGNEGGGVRGQTGAAFYFMDSTMEANTAGNGGGFYSRLGSSTVENSIFVGNTATTFDGNQGGGAISLTQTSASLRNSLFHQNSALVSSVVYFHVTTGSGYDLFIYNCTLVDNSTSGGGAHVIRFRRLPSQQSYFHIFNSIIYNNSVSTINIQTTSLLADIIMSHNCHEHALSDHGPGNITVPPLFVDAAADNYRLSRDSPCINTGTNMTWMTGAVDLDGKPRIDGVHNQVDMGAYEYQYPGTILFVR